VVRLRWRWNSRTCGGTHRNGQGDLKTVKGKACCWKSNLKEAGGGVKKGGHLEEEEPKSLRRRSQKRTISKQARVMACMKKKVNQFWSACTGGKWRGMTTRRGRFLSGEKGYGRKSKSTFASESS